VKHREVAIGVPGGNDWTFANMQVDGARFQRAVVQGLERRVLDQLRLILANAKFSASHAADHLMSSEAGP
jgi:hypothetical protein